MARKSALALCLAWLMLPVTALGLGLGEIETDSALNEPFQARVFLQADNPAELRDLDVRLASPEAYDRAGILRSDALLNLNFEVKDDVQPPYIAITSRQPIREPFLSLLLEIGHARGRLQREYTVLLDPPTMMPAEERREPQAPTVERSREPEPRRAEPEPQPRERWTPPPTPEVAETQPSERVEQEPSERTEEQPPVEERAPQMAEEAPRARPAPRRRPEPAQQPEPAPALPEEYQVRRGDTLWELADRFAAGEVATHQMMMALYERNPQAFRNNINLMHEGAVLRVPSRSQASAYSLAEAGELIEQDRRALRGETPETSAEVAEKSEEPRLELVAPGETDDSDSEAVSPGVSEDIAEMSESELREALAAERTRVQSEREQREALEDEVGTLREEVESLEALIALGADDIAAFEARLAEMQEERDAIANMSFVAEPVEVLLEEHAALLERLALEAALAQQVGVDDDKQSDTATAGEDEKDEEVEAVAASDEPGAPAGAADDPSGGLVNEVTAALKNPMVLGGVLGTIALLGLLAFQRRRRAGEQTDLDEVDEMVEVEPSRDEDEEALFAEAMAEEEEADDESAGDDSQDADEAGSADEEESDPLADEDDSFELPGDTDDESSDDPASEADFHMSYGMYDEALEAINRAIDDSPSDEALKAKRLEVLSAAGKPDDFLAQARTFAEEHGTDSNSWSKIAEMGRELLPGEALFSDEGGDNTGDDELLDFGEDSSDAEDAGDDVGEVDLSDETGDDDQDADDGDKAAAADESEDAGDLDFDLGDFDADASADSGDDKAAADDGDDDLAFDLDTDEGSSEESESDSSKAADEDDDSYSIDTGESGGDDDELSFNMDESDSGSDEQSDADDAYKLDESEDFGDLDFDSGDSDTAGESKEASSETAEEVDFDADSDSTADEGSAAENKAEAGAEEELPDLPNDEDLDEYDEIQTRIDLARAYMGMDDKEGAQSVLEEVLQEGEERHKKQARGLLEELTGEAPEAPAGNGASGKDADSSGDGAAADAADTGGDEPVGEGDDIGTQLDLARAYVDMGDEEGATKLIEQVLSEGDEEQKREAEELKQKLSS